MLSPDVPEFKPRYLEEPVSTYQEPETPHPHWEQNFQATSAPYNSYLLSGGGYGGDFAAHYLPQSFSPLHLPPPASHGPHPISPYSEGASVNQNYRNIIYEVSDSCSSWSPTHQNVSGFHQRGIYSPWKQKKHYGHHIPCEENMQTRSGHQKNSNNHKKYTGRKASKSHESGERSVESSSRSEVKKSVKWPAKEHSDQQLTKKAPETLVVTDECWPSLNPNEKITPEKQVSTDKATVIENGNCIDSDRVWSKSFSEAFKGSAPIQFFPKEASLRINEPGLKEEGQNRNINSLKKKKSQKCSNSGSKSKKDNVIRGSKSYGLKKDRFSEGELKKEEMQPVHGNHKHNSDTSRLCDGQQNISGRKTLVTGDEKPTEFITVGKEGSSNTDSKPSEKIVRKETNNKKKEFQVKETMAKRIMKSVMSKNVLENTNMKRVETVESRNTLTLESNEECVKDSHIGTLNSNQIKKAVDEWHIVKSEKKKKNAVARDALKGEREKGNNTYVNDRKTENRLLVRKERRGQGSGIICKERGEKHKEESKNIPVKKSTQKLNKSIRKWNQADESNKENSVHLKRYGGSGVEAKQSFRFDKSRKANSEAKVSTEPLVSVWGNNVDKVKETGARPKTGSFNEQHHVEKLSLSPSKDVSRGIESSVGEIPDPLDRTVDKHLEDKAKKKEKRMEEKRKKRELKLRLAKELANKDVRITIVTKEMVESLMPNKESVKNVQKYNITTETYPALEHFPSLNTRMSKTSEPQPSVSQGSKGMPKLQNVVDVINDPEWENIEEPSPLKDEVPAEPASLSYSLALKAVSKKPPPPPAISITKVKKVVKEKEAKPPPTQPKKKVKTKDLIQLDILSMLEQQKTKKQQVKKENRTSPVKTSQQKTAPTVTVGGVIKAKIGREREGKRRKVSSLRKRLQREEKLKSRDLMLVLKEYAKNSSTLQKINKEETRESPDEECSAEKSETNEEEGKESEAAPKGAEALEDSSSVSELPENTDIEGLKTILLKDLKSRENAFHNKRFREYCNQLVTPEIDKAVSDMIEMLVKFQERHYQRDPVKARMRRRYVCGLKETTKLMNKMSCIILVPNIQRSAIEGSLDDQVKKLINKATECEVPVVFALARRLLGFLLHKHAGVSCMGIINFQGAQDAFNRIMELVPAAQEQYHKMISLPGRQAEEDDGGEGEDRKMEEEGGNVKEVGASNKGKEGPSDWGGVTKS